MILIINCRLHNAQRVLPRAPVYAAVYFIRSLFLCIMQFSCNVVPEFERLPYVMKPMKGDEDDQ